MKSLIAPMKLFVGDCGRRRSGDCGRSVAALGESHGLLPNRRISTNLPATRKLNLLAGGHTVGPGQGPTGYHCVMKRLALSILASLAAANALAQSPAGGMFLVATPQLRDPRFAETVVLVLNHGNEGAIGVVVNRPTWVEPEVLFPDVNYFRRYRGVVYFGGPVARTSALFLIRDGNLAEGEPIVDDVYITADVDEVRENLPARTDERVLRVYAGYAGWGPGQL